MTKKVCRSASWTSIPELLHLLEELGVIEIREETVRPRQLQQVYRMLRLKQTMGVNLPGAAIILDLLERIEALQAEVDRLKDGQRQEVGCQRLRAALEACKFSSGI